MKKSPEISRWIYEKVVTENMTAAFIPLVSPTGLNVMSKDGKEEREGKKSEHSYVLYHRL